VKHVYEREKKTGTSAPNTGQTLIPPRMHQAAMKNASHAYSYRRAPAATSPARLKCM
jgi:hypothetical protein